jgi:gliding motility-associated-like protein
MADGTSYENLETVVHTFQNSGNYNVRLQIVDERTCQVRDVTFKTIQVFDDQISIVPEQTICEGESIQLQASGGISYSWRESESLSNANTANPIASPLVNTTYSVSVTTPNGCVKEASTVVKVKPILKANFETSDKNGGQKGLISGCAPLAIRFKNTSENANTYSWQFEGLGTSQASDTVSRVFNAPGTYIVTLKVTNAATCTTEEQITKTITVYGSGLSVVPDGVICAGEGYQLGANGGISYSWTPTSGLNSNNIANPMASPAITTTYTVTITTSNNCIVDSTVLVTVIPNIEEFFTVAQKQSCTAPTEYTFNFAASNGSTNSILQLGDGTTSQVSPFTHSFSKPGNYIVSLATDANCVIDFEREIEVVLFEIANAFSPNGDGINDFFEVPVVGSSLAIFTRAGQKVYENTNYQNEWDAKNLAAGTYYYAIKYPDGETCNGWIQVVR